MLSVYMMIAPILRVNADTNTLNTLSSRVSQCVDYLKMGDWSVHCSYLKVRGKVDSFPLLWSQYVAPDKNRQQKAAPLNICSAPWFGLAQEKYPLNQTRHSFIGGILIPWQLKVLVVVVIVLSFELDTLFFQCDSCEIDISRLLLSIEELIWLNAVWEALVVCSPSQTLTLTSWLINESVPCQLFDCNDMFQRQWI